MYIPPVALALLGSLSQLLQKPSYPKHVTYRPSSRLNSLPVKCPADNIPFGRYHPPSTGLNNGAILPAPAFGVGSVIKFSNVTDNVVRGVRMRTRVRQLFVKTRVVCPSFLMTCTC